MTQAGGIQNAGSVDQAYATLDSLGMTWSVLKRSGENTPEYQFECTIPSKQTAGVHDYIQAKGVGRLGALQDAINQIKQKQAGN